MKICWLDLQAPEPSNSESDSETASDIDNSENLSEPSDAESETTSDINIPAWEEMPQREPSKDISPNEQTKFIVFEECLKELFSRCLKCGTPAVRFRFLWGQFGTLLKVLYGCDRGHSGVWYSQPMIRGMAAGNLLLSSAILFAGLTYDRVRELSDTLRIPILSENHFYAIQKLYIFPVIHTEYTKQKEAFIAACGQDNLTLIGDGRCDSPGYSAKYCTYSLMDVKSGAVLSFIVRHVGLSTSSVAMEPDGCYDTLCDLESYGLEISVLGTDRHSSIAKLLRTNFQNITHQFDAYHIEKSIRKKLLQKANRHGCFELHAWIRCVTNHLWYCCQNCDQRPELLREKWLSIIYHIADQHEWHFFDHFHKCEHTEMDENSRKKKKWLKPGSPSHDALKEVVMDQHLISGIQKLNLAVHTGNLEAFHSLINKYCPKRQSFSYKGMISRTELAAMDHNSNLSRAQAKTADGRLRYNAVFPKGTKNGLQSP